MRKIYRLSKLQNNYSFILTGKGGNQMRYNFKGNVVTNTPARLSLNNEYAQSLLEGSDAFKRKKIVLERSVADAKDVATKNKKEETALTAVTTVVSVSDAINYVVNTYGEKVRSGATAKQVAAAHGVYFPNLK